VSVDNSEGGFRRSTEGQLATAAEGSRELHLPAVVDLVEGSDEVSRDSKHGGIVKRLCATVLEPAGVSAASCRDVPGILLGRLQAGWEEPELKARLRLLVDRAQRPNVDNPPGFLVMLLRNELAQAAPPPPGDTERGRDAAEVNLRRQRLDEEERLAMAEEAELEEFESRGTTPMLDRLDQQGRDGIKVAADMARARRREYREKLAARERGGEARSDGHA